MVRKLGARTRRALEQRRLQRGWRGVLALTAGGGGLAVAVPAGRYSYSWAGLTVANSLFRNCTCASTSGGAVSTPAQVPLNTSR